MTQDRLEESPVALLHPDGTTSPRSTASVSGRVRPAAGQVPPGAIDRLFTTYRAIQASQTDLAEVMRLTVRNAVELLDADYACVWRPSNRPGRGRVVAVVGELVEPRPAQVSPDETGIGRCAIALRQPVLAIDYRAYADRAPPPVTSYLARSEGLASVLCVPLHEADENAGLLYIGRRRQLGFDAGDISIASALAGQASLALRNGRLRRTLEEQHALLKHSAAVTERLSLAADRDGVDGVLRALAREIGRRVELDPAEPDEESGEAAAATMIFNVVAGSARYGRLHVFGRPLSPYDAISVERAIGMIAREITRRRTARQALLRSGSQLLGALLDGVNPNQPNIAQRAQAIGFDLDRPVTVVAIAHRLPDIADLHEAAVEAGGLGPHQLIAADAGEHAFLALATPSGWTAQPLMGRLLALPEVVAAGVGSPRRDVVAAADEATACLSLAVGSPARDTVFAGDLGPLWFLLGAVDPVDAMRRHVTATLGNLHGVQASSGVPLLETLRVYLDCGRRPSAAAQTLGVHRNTLKYRLGRLRDLLGQPLVGDFAFDLWLAVRALDLLVHLGHPPFPAGVTPGPSASNGSVPAARRI